MAFIDHSARAQALYLGTLASCSSLVVSWGFSVFALFAIRSSVTHVDASEMHIFAQNERERERERGVVNISAFSTMAGLESARAEVVKGCLPLNLLASIGEVSIAPSNLKY